MWNVIFSWLAQKYEIPISLFVKFSWNTASSFFYVLSRLLSRLLTGESRSCHGDRVGCKIWTICSLALYRKSLSLWLNGESVWIAGSCLGRSLTSYALPQSILGCTGFKTLAEQNCSFPLVPPRWLKTNKVIFRGAETIHITRTPRGV